MSIPVISRVLTLLATVSVPLSPTLAGPRSQVSGPVIYRNLQPDVAMTDWLVCGPFTIEAPGDAPEETEPLRKSFTHDFLAEHGGEAKIAPSAGLTHHLRGQPYVWRRIAGQAAFINLIDLFGLQRHAAAYAYAELEMPAPTRAILGVGSDDGVKIWLNGEVVHENWTFRAFAMDQDQIPVQLREGRNRLLIKVQNGYNPPWGFACRRMSPRSINRTLVVAAGTWWDPRPAALRALLDRLEPDLAAGPIEVARHWPLEVFVQPSYRESLFRVLSFPLAPALRLRLGRAAERLAAIADQLPIESRSDAFTIAGWFHAAAGRTRPAMAAAEAALHRPGSHASAAFLRADLRYRVRGRRGRAPIDEYIHWEMERQHLPGLSVAVVRAGKPLVVRGWGQANVELSSPATGDTVYRLASLSKPFTALAIMLLVEDGKLALEDPIRKYRPDWPTAWNDIRVRHLLTHTAALPDYLNEIPAPPGGYRTVTTPDSIVQMVADLPLKFPPGAQWHYDNTAFVLLRLIIEKVTGKSYSEFLAERIFQPLGMSATRVYSFSDVIPNRAGHYLWEENRLRNVIDLDPSWGTSGAELASTAADLVKLHTALCSGRLLKPATLEQMRTPTRLTDGKTVNWGMGWVLGQYRGYRSIGHEGSSPGSACGFWSLPEAQYAVILLTHFYDPSIRDIIAQIRDLYPPALTSVIDRDPQTTQALKRALLHLVDGQADLAPFTPEARSVLAPELRQVTAFYRSLGPLTSFQFIEQTRAEEGQIYRYRTVFRDTTWIHQFLLTINGRIAELAVAPE